jgi:hypothetical protein
MKPSRFKFRSIALPPAIDRAVIAEVLDRLDRAIERYPSHDFGMGEVPARSANLPDAIVWFVPTLFQKAKRGALEIPGRLRLRQPMPATEMQGIEQLAINVELELP